MLIYVDWYTFIVLMAIRFMILCFVLWDFFFFQAEDGIRDLVRSRGLGDVYKRQISGCGAGGVLAIGQYPPEGPSCGRSSHAGEGPGTCLLYTSDAADERSSVDLGGRRIIKKKTRSNPRWPSDNKQKHDKQVTD